jgi:hypothetical protein
MGRASNRKKALTRVQRLGPARTGAPRGLLDINLHTTAYHEAGHICVAEALGHRTQYAWVDLRGRRDPYSGESKVGYFEIDAPEWARGTLTPDLLREEGRWRYLYSRLIVATAGHVSEGVYCNGMGLPYHEDMVSDRDEMFGPAKLSCAVPTPEGGWTLDEGLGSHIITDAGREAERILQERWRAVGALAAALMARTDLSGDEVRAVLQEADGLHPALHVDWPSPPSAPDLMVAVP